MFKNVICFVGCCSKRLILLKLDKFLVLLGMVGVRCLLVLNNLFKLMIILCRFLGICKFSMMYIGLISLLIEMFLKIRFRSFFLRRFFFRVRFYVFLVSLFLLLNVIVFLSLILRFFKLRSRRFRRGISFCWSLLLSKICGCSRWLRILLRFVGLLKVCGVRMLI